MTGTALKGPFTRRQFVERGAVLGAAAVIAPSLLARRATAAENGSRVVIIGAGLAGLSCADRLVRAGVMPTIYEARPDRIGGRCWSSRGWADGQVAEHGGEFLDTRHKRMRRLAKRFGLSLDDLFAAGEHGRTRLWLKGAERRFEPLRAARIEVRRKLQRDAARIGPYGYGRASRAAKAMDEMSVSDWLDANVDGGSKSLVGHLVGLQMTGEFGLDARDLSALNLLYEYVEAPATADERFHVRGGNDQIVDGLAAALPEGTINLDSPLEALAALADGTYSLRIGGVAADVAADHVVLCLPFTTLRKVDLTKAGLSRHKLRCIDELGMGTNAKVIFQTAQRPSSYGRWNGSLVSDRPNFLSWESSLAQPGKAGLITCYPGGRSGGVGLRAPDAHAVASPQLAAEILGDFNRAGLAPIAKEQIGDAWVDHWSLDPWVEGAYAAFLPGQYTRFYGYAGRPQAGIHFAGEHTATAYQGYLEGAVESGERAATEVFSAIAAPDRISRR